MGDHLMWAVQLPSLQLSSQRHYSFDLSYIFACYDHRAAIESDTIRQ